MKAGDIDFKAGQWFYSKKFNNKGRYIGTYLTIHEGVVKPYVHISWPVDGERLVDWNKRYVVEAAEAKKKHRYAKATPKVEPYVERRKPIVVDMEVDLVEVAETLPEVKEVTLVTRSIWSKVKGFFS
jgi:hypothetical protein